MAEMREYMEFSIGFSGLLAIVFVVLKLAKIIAWKWIWVLSPIWIGLIVDLLILILWLIAKGYIRIRKKKAKHD